MSINAKEIAVDQIIPTPQNRRHIDTKSAKWKEFVESVRKNGVLTPLLVRPMPDHGGGHSPAELDDLAHAALVDRDCLMDLRAGHRRLAAAKEAGLAAVPVVIREMDDQTAMIVTITENKDREDLTPIEDAEQIAEARKVGLDDKTIADKLGKSEAWVAKRAKLLNLSKRWRESAANPEHYVSTWPAGALEAVARLHPDTQDRIDIDDVFDQLKLDQKPLNVPAFEKYIASEVLRTLGGAPFKLDDASLLPKAGACSTCPKRASQEAILFEELRGSGKKSSEFQDRCLDRVCYDKKIDAHVSRRLSELEMEHGKSLPVIQSGTLWHDEQAAKAKHKSAVSPYNFNDAKAGEKGAIPGVFVTGRAKGQVCWLKPRNADTREGAKRAKPAGEKVITPLKDRRKTLQARRVAQAVTKFEEWLDTPDAIKAFAGKGGMLMSPLITVFGTDTRANCRGDIYTGEVLYPNSKGKSPDSWAAFEKLRSVDNDLGLRCGAERVLPVLRSRVKYFSLEDAANSWDEAKRIGALVDHDMDAVLAAATAELPEPASWAREEAAPKRAKPAKPAKEAKHARPKAKAKAAK